MAESPYPSPAVLARLRELEQESAPGLPSLGEWQEVRDALPGLLALVAAQQEAIASAKTLIEYARYELQPGKAVFGDQFPKQADADNRIAKLAALLAAGGEK